MAKDSPFDRALPSNIEAERSILGAILLDNQTINQAAEMLRRDDFFLDSHRRIYDKMLHLMELGRAIDPITLQDALRQSGDLDLIGGAAFIGALIDGVPRFSNIQEYCSIVKGKSIVRKLITTSNQIINRCFDAEDSPDILLDEAERAILSIAEDRIRQGFVPISEVAHKQLQHIEEIAGREQLVTGISTGFRDLDYMTSGLQRGDLIILAARPSMGKCLAHDAEIVLEDGSLVTIEEIYRRQAARLLTLNDNWKLSFTSPSAFVDDGIKPVFKVTTKLGRTVESTITHPFLTFDGWRKLGELKVGDKIAVPREINVFGQNRLSDKERDELVASIAANHHALPSVIFQLTREHLALFLNRLLAIDEGTENFEKNFHSVPTGRDVIPQDGVERRRNAILGSRKNNTPALKGRHKFYPAPSGLMGILATLPGVAPMLHPRLSYPVPLGQKAEGRRIRYTTANENLAYQLQHLLLRFGILAQRSKQPIKEQNADRIQWQLEITHADSLQRFAAEICGVAPINDALPPLKKLATSDVYWDEITSIEFVNERQVYDLTIPNTHNFVANDICVHNTAFCLNIAQNAAMRQQHHGNKAIVGIFSLEMSKEQLVQRMLCAQARIDAHRLRTGMLSKEDWRHLAMGVSELAEAQIFLDDTPAISSLEMRAKIRRLKNEQRGLDLIIVDYLQLMSGKGKIESRQQEVSQISRDLKAIAKEMNVPLIALSQLSRAVETRSDHRPQLSDLRESGSIEQDADLVMFIYRDEVYNAETEKQNVAEIIIGKQRNGPIGEVELVFLKQLTRFEDKYRE